MAKSRTKEIAREKTPQERVKDKQEYYAEDEFDDAHIAERATDILDNLAEIFGSDEQED